MYNEEQRKYADFSDESKILSDLIQFDMTAGSLGINGYVCMRENSVG